LQQNSHVCEVTARLQIAKGQATLAEMETRRVSEEYRIPR
jgi:hypothetical protein